MKFFRKVLRFWIALASILTFLGGWIILAHSPKPVQTQPGTVQQAVLPDLPPIQAYGSNVNNNGLGFFSNNAPATTNQSLGSVPRLRTRGS